MAKCVLLPTPPPQPPLLLPPPLLQPPPPPPLLLPPPRLLPPVDNPFSLYVGDLHPNVTEIDLYTLFSTIGPLNDVHLSRDRLTQKSLCYAFINFYLPVHAADALCRLNHKELKGKPIRIMWRQIDPFLRKTGIGNLFVKNLDLSVHDAKLEEAFAIFGRVLSCKIAKEDDGKSKGFGFVQFESEESASDALHALNGCVFGGKTITVAKFIRKSERKEPQFTNVYVKNLDKDFTESSLIEKFSKYGKVTSSLIVKDDDGKSRGFGFVNFELHDHAKMAIEALNGAEIGSKKWFVEKAMMKAARDSLLRRRTNQEPKPNASYLIVRNLATSVNEKDLREVFGEFGCVKFTKVLRSDNGVSRGIASVCFSKPEEAKKVMKNLNGFCYRGKYINVSFAPSKQEFEYARRLRALLPSPFLFRVPILKKSFESKVQKEDEAIGAKSSNGGFSKDLRVPKFEKSFEAEVQKEYEVIEASSFNGGFPQDLKVPNFEKSLEAEVEKEYEVIEASSCNGGFSQDQNSPTDSESPTNSWDII